MRLYYYCSDNLILGSNCSTRTTGIVSREVRQQIHRKEFPWYEWKIFILKTKLTEHYQQINK
jgi:hypothetical protein